MSVAEEILKKRAGRTGIISPSVKTAAKNQGYYGTGFPTSSLDSDTRRTIGLYDRIARANGMKLPSTLENPSLLSKTLDVLRTGEYAVGGLMSGVGVVEGVKGRISPSEVLGIADDETKLFSGRGLLGLAADILLDPTTYITFGFGGGAKLATKLGPKVLNKSGKGLLKKATAKFGQERGYQMVANRILQPGGEKFLDKGGLKYFGVEFASRATLKKPFGVVGKGFGAVEDAIPILGRVTGPTGKVLKSGRSVFNNAFRPRKEMFDSPMAVRLSLEKQLPDLVAQYGNAGAEKYIARQVGAMTEMVNGYVAGFTVMAKASRNEISQTITTFGRLAKKADEVWGKNKAGPIIANLIETGSKSGVKEIDDIILQLGGRGRMGEILKAARTEGIKIGRLENYVPHTMTKEFKKLFGDDAISYVGNPTKHLRISGNAAKHRKWLKFVDAGDGSEIVTTAEKAGLVPYWRPSEVKAINESIGKLMKRNSDAINTIDKDVAELVKRMGKTEERAMKSFKSLFKAEDTKRVGTLEYLLSKDNATLKLIKKSLSLKDTKYAKLLDDLIDIKKLGDAANGEISKMGDEFFDVVSAKNMTKMQKIAKDIIDLPAENTWYQRVTDGKVFFPKQATVKEINEETLKLYGTKMFEEDVFRAMSVGAADQIRDTWMARFFNDIARNIGVPADEITKIVRNPVTRKASKESIVLPKVVDGMRYVPVKAPQLKGVLFPEIIAKDLDDYMKFLTNDETLNAFVKQYDNLLRFWKGSVTGVFPAFHTRNFLGGSFNNWLGGLKNPVRYQQAHKAIKLIEDYRKLVVDVGEAKAGKMPTMIVDTEFGKINLIDELLDFERLGGRGQTGIFDVAQTVDEIKKRAASGKFGRSTVSPRKAMEFVEDRLRLPMFFDRRIKGDDAASAMKDVFKYHFDYSPEGLTAFERNAMKRVIPFYRWARGNIPLQIQEIVKQPGKFAGIAKVIGDLEDGAFYLPGYVRDGITIKVSEDDQKGVAKWLYSTGLPIDDINRIWAGNTKDTLRRFIGEYLSPFLKYPIEAAGGYSFFFNQPIDERNYVYPYINSIPGLRAWLGVKSYNRRDGQPVFVSIYPRRLHALESFVGRFYTTAGKVLTEDGEPHIGLKESLYELFSPARIREFEIDKEEQRRIDEYIKEVGNDLLRTSDLRKFEKFYLPKNIESQLNDYAARSNLISEED